jgi:hypothetical protein
VQGVALATLGSGVDRGESLVTVKRCVDRRDVEARTRGRLRHGGAIRDRAEDGGQGCLSRISTFIVKNVRDRVLLLRATSPGSTPSGRAQLRPDLRRRKASRSVNTPEEFAGHILSSRDRAGGLKVAQSLPRSFVGLKSDASSRPQRSPF